MTPSQSWIKISKDSLSGSFQTFEARLSAQHWFTQSAGQEMNWSTIDLWNVDLMPRPS